MQTATSAGPIGPAPAYDPAEAAAVSRAVPKRRDEFLTGRALARSALAQLGCPPCAIPVGTGRSPQWPGGYLGTISHDDEVCVAHVARSSTLLGIGIDVERAGALPSDLVASIATPAEWAILSAGGGGDVDVRTLCFSAKEAVFKAYFPATATFLDFTDVQLAVLWSQGAFTATLSAEDKPGLAGRRSFHGRFAGIGDHIVTAVWVVPGAERPPARGLP